MRLSHPDLSALLCVMLPSNVRFKSSKSRCCFQRRLRLEGQHTACGGGGSSQKVIWSLGWTAVFCCRQSCWAVLMNTFYGSVLLCGCQENSCLICSFSPYSNKEVLTCFWSRLFWTKVGTPLVIPRARKPHLLVSRWDLSGVRGTLCMFFSLKGFQRGMLSAEDLPS